MKIGVYSGDYTPASGGAYTLIEEIKAEVLAHGSDHEFIFFCYDSVLDSAFYRDGLKYINLFENGFGVRLNRKLHRIVHSKKEFNRLETIAHEENLDLIWLLGPYDVKTSIPYIFTVWDLGHREKPYFPELSTEGWSWQARESLYQKMIYRAAFVITGNKAGEKEIRENYPISSGKIKIIPFPFPNRFARGEADAPKGLDLTCPFVFYPAQFWAHKNHIVLVEATKYLRDTKNVRINCYFAGSDKGNQGYIVEKINEYRLSDQIKILGFVTDAQLAYLYKNSLALTYVSLLGPNNLPPFEAATFGCPIIISDLPGHIEQMEDCALMVDATDEKALGEAIYALYSSDETRNAFVQKSKALMEKHINYSYFAQMQKIFSEFALARRTWR